MDNKRWAGVVLLMLLVVSARAQVPFVNNYVPNYEGHIAVEEVVGFDDQSDVAADLRDYRKIIAISRPDPEYPSASIRMIETGEVDFAVLIRADGSVEEVKMMGTCSYPRLPEAVTRAALQWKFKPVQLAAGQSHVVGYFKAVFTIVDLNAGPQKKPADNR